MVDKIDLLKKYLELLTKKKEQAKRSLDISVEDSREAEGAMQSRYSTFKEEAQYLSQGHFLRLRRFNESIATINKVIDSLTTFEEKNHEKSRLLSLIEIIFDDTGDEKKYLLIPGEGFELIDDVNIIGVSTPLGKQLLSRETGDDFDLVLPKGPRSIEILNVS